MLSEAGITFLGFTITTTQLWLAGSAVLCVALFVALARVKRIAMQRSVVTDEIAIQLGRIAAAVEQLAGEAAARRVMEENKQRANVTLPPAVGEEKHPIAYSMFGR